MNQPLKIFLIIVGISSIIIGGFSLVIIFALKSIFIGPLYNKQDLIDNFELKTREILEVKSYLDSKVPADTYIFIEFKAEQIRMFDIRNGENYDTNWDLDINSRKTDSLLNVIGWMKEDLYILKDMLYSANCISVSSGKPVRIGWQRSGLGKFYYSIFDRRLDDSLLKKYNDGCTYIYYKDNIVLEYAGGAIGSNCFPLF